MASVHNMEYDLDCWRVKLKNSMKNNGKKTQSGETEKKVS